MLALVNLTLLVAPVGSGAVPQLGAPSVWTEGDDIIQRRFFGAIPLHGVPRSNVLLSGALARFA